MPCAPTTGQPETTHMGHGSLICRRWVWVMCSRGAVESASRNRERAGTGCTCCKVDVAATVCSALAVQLYCAAVTPT